jgi:signal transduction histidine kinase
MLIANYTGAAYAGRWRLASLGLVLLTEVVVYARIPAERVEGEILFGVFVALGTWIVGDVVRARSRRARRVLGDAQLLVAQGEAATAAALAEERGSIARELHDVIAHSVSVMGVQAGAARLLIECDPDAARAALLEVEAAARSSVEELRRLLAVLRDDDRAAAGLAPQPGLAQLDGLVGQVRAAGLDVSLRVAAGLRVPPGLELVVFRIVQEALTNALKHAGTPTRVVVGQGHGVVDVEVANEGPPAASRAASSPAAGARHGLIGMRERVQLYGGTWSARPTADGGFIVRAQLPVRDDSMLDPVS